MLVRFRMERWLLVVACLCACRAAAAPRSATPLGRGRTASCPAVVLAFGTEVDLPPAARARLRDGTRLRIVGRGPGDRVLVEVQSRIRLRGVLGNSGADVAFARETVLAPNVVAARGAKAEVLWFRGERLVVRALNGEHYATTCDSLATAMPPEPDEKAIAVTHRTRTSVLLLDGQGQRVADLPENYPVLVRASVTGDRVPVTAQFVGYTFHGFLPRDVLATSTDPEWGGGLWSSSLVLVFLPDPTSWPYPDYGYHGTCSGTAVLRAGAVVSDGARTLLTTTRAHQVKLEATKPGERLVILTDVDPAIEELLAWVSASDLTPSDCAPAPPGE